jgi:hypothetical protein
MANVPGDEKEQSNQYPEAALCAAMAASVWNGSSAPVKMDIPISERLQMDFKRILGTEVQSLFITDSDVRHIKKQHGQGEALRGQIDITPEDFALIPLVLNEYDTIEQTEIDTKGNRKVLFTKKCNGMVYLATIERGPYKGEIRTLWKMTR